MNEDQLKQINRKIDLLWALLTAFAMSQGFSQDDIALLVKESDKVSTETRHKL